MILLANKPNVNVLINTGAAANLEAGGEWWASATSGHTHGPKTSDNAHDAGNQERFQHDAGNQEQFQQGLAALVIGAALATATGIAHSFGSS